MSSVIFLLLAAAAAVGLFRTLRGRAENERYLEEAGEDLPLAVEHLPRALQQMAYETRALRLSLEHPLRQLERSSRRGAGEVDPLTIRQELTNASREIGDFLRTLERLGEEDRARLADVGAKPALVRDLFAAEGFSLELQGAGARALRRVAGRIRELQRELARLERALQTQSDPYR